MSKLIKITNGIRGIDNSLSIKGFGRPVYIWDTDKKEIIIKLDSTHAVTKYLKENINFVTYKLKTKKVFYSKHLNKNITLR